MQSLSEAIRIHQLLLHIFIYSIIITYIYLCIYYAEAAHSTNSTASTLYTQIYT